MKGLRLFSLILALMVSLCLSYEIKAASLFGKVIEISDGDTLTVFNLNRPVRVRLVGIAAPVKDQPFGDVARQHLRDLVYDKLVLVEYSGLDHNGSLEGRVSLDGNDVGAQMIRDGVAWYDPRYRSRFNESELQIYLLSEQAARNERRGLWQADSPIPPWEFGRSGSKPASLAGTRESTKSPRTDRPPAELTSESLLKTELARSLTGSSASSGVGDSIYAPPPVAATWQRLQPAGEHFSALVPSEGKLLKEPVPFGNQVVDVNVYIARDSWAIYALMWATGPSGGESDDAAIDGTMRGFLRGIGKGYESVGGKFSCEAQNRADISLRGYTGREYDLRACTIAGMARAYSKEVGNQRQMYIGAVFFAREDSNVKKFLNSYTVNDSKNSNMRPAVKSSR